MIRFENVGLRYGKGREVLRDVSFELASGSFHFLTGPSGAGKTSLLRLLFLSLQPTRGVITLFNRDVSAMSRRQLPDVRRRIGVVFQDFRLLDHLTTFDNVALPLRVRGERVEHYRDNVLELLDWVGLGDRVDAYPAILSGGEQQRAAIARAVVGKPEIVLADEPTGNVDPELARRLLRLFVELNRFGSTILIATHDVALMEELRAPKLMLSDGDLELSP
ncbi:cell division transport system ATP-binding protein [Rhodoligotrophos appendicifer]|uniref:cell division ATP-binding protein FtsE n=1 Tax=Rhodoligotrophos appendicifer TaxID=987056 RepID=UPI0011854D40|nr:cell division ATP-binding protein FtsE [Rhodoligotrophos appendicifer]